MLNKWLRYLWANEDGFFGIGQGPSSAENAEFSSLAQIGNFTGGEGEGDILASDNFWKSILSGDPGQISKVLGPEFSAINKRGQEQKKTSSEFGTRSGGTNAFMQTADDTTRSSVDALTSDLTSKAATTLGATGANLLGTSVGAHEGAFSAANTIQGQHAAQMNDLFKSIAAVAAAPFTGGASLGATGSSGSTSGGTGNWWDNVDFPSSSGGGGDYTSGGGGI
jgi:hypothetical protein